MQEELKVEGKSRKRKGREVTKKRCGRWDENATKELAEIEEVTDILKNHSK